jgi:hypothetical protein
MSNGHQLLRKRSNYASSAPSFHFRLASSFVALFRRFWLFHHHPPDINDPLML